MKPLKIRWKFQMRNLLMFYNQQKICYRKDMDKMKI